MRRVILVLLGLLIPVALAWWIAELPGRVSARFGDYAFDASLPVVALVLLVLYAAVHVLLRLIAWLLGVPAQLRAVRAARARRAGDAALTAGLVALAAGEGARARRHVEQARRLLGDTPHMLLLAAEAAHRSARPEEAQAAYRQLAEHPQAGVLGVRGLLQQAIGRQDWAEAAALARRVEAAHPGSASLREERYRLALLTRNWREALTLAPAQGPRAALATAASLAEPDAEAALRLARQAVEADARLAPATIAYATRLRAAGKERRAMAVLRDGWAVAPHPDIAALALAPITDKLARHQAAVRLTEAAPDHVESLVLRARTALEAGLIGEARRHAELARGRVDQRLVWLLLADIAEAEGDGEASRAALRGAAAAGPDPSWRCGQCGGLHAAWAPVCGMCGTAGRIGWSSSPTAALEPPPAVLRLPPQDMP